MDPVLSCGLHSSFSVLSEKERRNSKKIRRDFEEEAWTFSHKRAFFDQNGLFHF